MKMFLVFPETHTAYRSTTVVLTDYRTSAIGHHTATNYFSCRWGGHCLMAASICGRRQLFSEQLMLPLKIYCFVLFIHIYRRV